MSNRSIVCIAMIVAMNLARFCPADEIPVEQVLESIEQSRRALGGIEYTYSVFSVFAKPDGNFVPEEVTAERTVRRDGSSLYYEEKSTNRFSANKQSSYVVRNVANPTYVARWLVGTNNPQMYTSDEATGQLSSNAKAVVDYTSRSDPLLLATATNRSHSLRDLSKENGTRLEASVSTDASGTKTIQVKFFRDGTHYVTFEIDPDKSYLVTRRTSYGQSGDVEDIQTISLEKFGDVWFPREIRMTQIRSGKEISRTIVKVSGVKTGMTFEDDEFSLNALGLPGNSLLFSITYDDLVTMGRFRSGAFVAEEDQPRRPAPRQIEIQPRQKLSPAATQEIPADTETRRVATIVAAVFALILVAAIVFRIRSAKRSG